MFPELTIIRHLFHILHARWQVLRADPEAGYSTETVVITALLVALAIGAVGIIASKVSDHRQQHQHRRTDRRDGAAEAAHAERARDGVGGVAPFEVTSAARSRPSWSSPRRCCCS